MLLDAEGFTGRPISKWVPKVAPSMSKNGGPHKRQGLFVDKCRCIGCTNCVHTACATFRLEPTYGRARVFAQWINTEDEIQEAIDTCPVSCIHWVPREHLPYLEYVTQVGICRWRCEKLERIELCCTLNCMIAA